MLRLFSSSIATKFVIALTGLALVGFLVGHLAGNLLILAGPETYNFYSHKLITNPLLIPAEIGLLVIFLMHVWKTVTNFRRNSAARPTGYRQKTWAGHTSRKSLGSTSMIVTGTVTLVFLVLHLITFKYGAWYQVTDDPDVRDLYRLVLEEFHKPGYVIWYVVAMVLIGLHLRHGISSALQSLGAMRPGMTRAVLMGGAALAAVIAGGFALIPLYVYFFTQ